MALDSLTFNFAPTVNWSAKKNLTGTDYGAVQNSSNITKPTITIDKTIANASAGGGDTMVSFIQSVAASGTATIDLSSVTDVINQAAQAFVRLKYIEFRLLSATDDTTNGTAATSVTIGNAATNANTM